MILKNNPSKFWGIISLAIFFVCISYFRNHIRLFVLRQYPVELSYTKKIKQLDEGDFQVSIYSCNRKFRKRFITKINKLFTDKIVVLSIPLEKIKLKNLILRPTGGDEISSDEIFHFNTLFFTEDFLPTTGLIYSGEKISNRSPTKTRLAINPDGKLMVFRSGSNYRFDDVLQAPFLLRCNTRTKKNLNSLNYRHFIVINGGKLIYITGYKNSLISWSDVKSILIDMNLQYCIALDGGGSLDYSFKGVKNTYQFSSIPFRFLWYKKNSPYYLEGV